jgi:peptidoglycan hydrolase CwlO-like protein
VRQHGTYNKLLETQTGIGVSIPLVRAPIQAAKAGWFGRGAKPLPFFFRAEDLHKMADRKDTERERERQTILDALQKLQRDSSRLIKEHERLTAEFDRLNKELKKLNHT